MIIVDNRFYCCLIVVLFASNGYCECIEYQIVDRGDSVEAVCVGKPLTPEEQKAKAEEDLREQQRINNQLKAEQKRERDRLAEERAAQERKAQEVRAQEQKNQEAIRNSARGATKNPTRLENAIQRTPNR